LDKQKYWQEALRDVAWRLKDIFDGSYEYYKEKPNSSFKVRPDYGYAKFYLNMVEGSYDMSLQALIHFILYEHKHFKKLLSKETYKELDPFMAGNPEYLFDFQRDEAEQDMIDTLEYYLIHYMRCLFEQNGLDGTPFREAGYELEPMLCEIHPCGVFEYIVVVAGNFFWSVEKYCKTHTLSPNQKETLLKIAQKNHILEYTIYLGETLAKQDRDLAKKTLKSFIPKIEKNSEYSKLSRAIIDILGDTELANEVKALKS
jgi:hypothetical protein